MAIIITIMVLEMKVPHGVGLAALTPILPVFLSYVPSFIYVGIYWNTHHHLFLSTKRVTGRILWANLHLLFWLSLFPFATGWMGENHLASLPTAVYGFVLLMAAIAYYLLQRAIIAHQGPTGNGQENDALPYNPISGPNTILAHVPDALRFARLRYGRLCYPAARTTYCAAHARLDSLGRAAGLHERS